VKLRGTASSRDRSLDIFLMVLFGMGGIAILVLAWVQPMPLPERILTTLFASVGLFWVLYRALSLISLRTKIDIGKDLSEVELKKKPY
jgi:membrane protein implicated in regulation of membrane protease activity